MKIKLAVVFVQQNLVKVVTIKLLIDTISFHEKVKKKKLNYLILKTVLHLLYTACFIKKFLPLTFKCNYDSIENF